MAIFNSDKSSDHEKPPLYDDETHAAVVAPVDDREFQPERPTELYDPNKESWMTRAGLNFESYKRAPGTTGGQHIEGLDEDPEAREQRLKDSPMLQQKMKPRHLQMIAVGGTFLPLDASTFR
jgi:amino acid transporter